MCESGSPIYLLSTHQNNDLPLDLSLEAQEVIMAGAVVTIDYIHGSLDSCDRLEPEIAGTYR